MPKAVAATKLDLLLNSVKTFGRLRKIHIISENDILQASCSIKQ